MVKKRILLTIVILIYIIGAYILYNTTKEKEVVKINNNLFGELA